MKFYISQTIGAGTEADPFRPAIDNYTQDWRCVDMRKDATISGLLFVECPVITDAQHNSAISDPLITHIDIGSLDDPLSLNADLAGLFSLLETYQIPVDDFDETKTNRDLLKRITKRFLLRQITAGNDVPDDLNALLTEPQKTALANLANNFGINVSLDKKTRDIIKDVTAINHQFLRTHYDN